MIRIASFFGIFTAAVLVAYFMYFREPYDLPVSTSRPTSIRRWWILKL